MSTPKLQSTTDYDLFEMHEFNRPLHHDPVLLESMKRNGFLPQWPIACERNGSAKLKVIAGHHRLAYAKRLSLPVWYVVDDSHVDICDIESSRRSAWSMKDHILARAAAGQEQYQFLLDFAEAHKIPLSLAIGLVYGESAMSGNAAKAVYRGTFRVGDMTHAYGVVAITDACYAAGVPCARQSLFIGAVSAVLRVPEFDVARFLARVRQYPAHMVRGSSTEHYLNQIDSLYNFTTRADKRVALAFRAAEVGKARQRSFGKKTV